MSVSGGPRLGSPAGGGTPPRAAHGAGWFMKTKTTVEIAEACQIMRPRVYILAKRLKGEPQGQDARGRTLWPSTLIAAIRAAQRGPDPREGSWAEDFRVEEGVLMIARRTKRADGGTRRRVLARVRLTPAARESLRALLT